MNQSQRGILKVKVINENCKVVQSSHILSESCQSTAGCVADGRGLCQKNQEKQIWMNTHQYVCIRPSGLRVLCQFRKFRISMIGFIGRVSNIRSDSCWFNILMLKGSIGNYHHLVLMGLVRLVLSFNPSFRFFTSKRNQINNIISSFLHQSSTTYQGLAYLLPQHRPINHSDVKLRNL